MNIAEGQVRHSQSSCWFLVALRVWSKSSYSIYSIIIWNTNGLVPTVHAVALLAISSGLKVHQQAVPVRAQTEYIAKVFKLFLPMFSLLRRQDSAGLRCSQQHHSTLLTTHLDGPYRYNIFRWRGLRLARPLYRLFASWPLVMASAVKVLHRNLN